MSSMSLAMKARQKAKKKGPTKNKVFGCDVLEHLQFTKQEAFWDATRAFMLLSILSCFAGIILGLTAFTSNAKASRIRSAGITLLIAGFFALLALSVYTGVTVNFFGKRYADWRFSWSYILGWIAVILTLSSGVFHIFAYTINGSQKTANVVSG